MRTHKQWLTYQSLELIPADAFNPPPLSPTRLPGKTILMALQDALAALFMPRHEPHIWQTKDALGQIWWHIYDPRTQQSVVLATEQEVRVWLDAYFSHRMP